MKGKIGAVLIGAILVLVLLALPAAAQDAPDTPAPLTMEEAERVVYGLRDALIEGDLDTALSFFAEEIEYLTHTETKDLASIHSWGEVQESYRGWLGGDGCRPLSVITGLEGNTAHVSEMWTCIPDHTGFWTALLAVDLQIEDGKIIRYEEHIFDANLETWNSESAQENEMAALLWKQNSRSRTFVESHFTDDATMTVVYDPLTAASRTAEGKDEVVALLDEWAAAGVEYYSSPWGNRGNTILARGTLMWPQLKEVMGVAMQTQDIYDFEDGLIKNIDIRADYRMKNAFTARVREAQGE